MNSIFKTLFCGLLLAVCPIWAQGYKGDENFSGTQVKGRVVWQGDLTGPLILDVKKNPEVCCGAPEPCKKDSGRWTVNSSNRGIKDCVVFLANYDVSVPGKAFPKAMGLVDQIGCHYEPHVALVELGKRLTIKNSDDLLHNVHGYLGKDTVFNLAMPLPGETKQKLKTPGRIELRCDAGHSWMTAWVFVIEHPYYAVTDENGGFDLGQVPDGVYQLVVWHEGGEVAEVLKNAEGQVTGYIFSEAIEMAPLEIVVSGGTVEGLPETIELKR